MKNRSSNLEQRRLLKLSSNLGQREYLTNKVLSKFPFTPMKLLTL